MELLNNVISRCLARLSVASLSQNDMFVELALHPLAWLQSATSELNSHGTVPHTFAHRVLMMHAPEVAGQTPKLRGAVGG